MHHNETREGLALTGVLSLPERDTRWMDEARCRDYPEVNFFPEPPQKSNAERARYELEAAKAKEVCEDCPVRAECLADALDRNEHWGIWGGEDLYTPWRILRHEANEAKAAS